MAVFKGTRVKKPVTSAEMWLTLTWQVSASSHVTTNYRNCRVLAALNATPKYSGAAVRLPSGRMVQNEVPPYKQGTCLVKQLDFRRLSKDDEWPNDTIIGSGCMCRASAGGKYVASANYPLSTNCDTQLSLHISKLPMQYVIPPTKIDGQNLYQIELATHAYCLFALSGHRYLNLAPRRPKLLHRRPLSPWQHWQSFFCSYTSANLVVCTIRYILYVLYVYVSVCKLTLADTDPLCMHASARKAGHFQFEGQHPTTLSSVSVSVSFSFIQFQSMSPPLHPGTPPS